MNSGFRWILSKYVWRKLNELSGFSEVQTELLMEQPPNKGPCLSSSTPDQPGASVIGVLLKNLGWTSVYGLLSDWMPPEYVTRCETEIRQMWQRGIRKPEVMVTLSHLYLHLKHFADAEVLAQQVCRKYEAQGLVALNDKWQRGVCDQAFLALAGVRTLQGNFEQAARDLDHYRQYNAWMSKHVMVYTAFAYLLAGDEAAARAVAIDFKPFEERDWGIFRREAYQLLVAYLRQRLLDVDESQTFEKLGDYIWDWISLYQSMADLTAYHERLREIVAGMADAVPMGWLRFALKRLEIGEVEALIAEAEAKRAQGDQTYRTALVLGGAYAHLGYGEKAEPLARAAFSAVEAEGWFARPDDNAQYLTDVAHLAVHSALIMQGRFAEAADCLTQIAPRSLTVNLCLMMCAWAYFLAGEGERSRAVMAQMLPIESDLRSQLSPRFALVHAYVNLRLGIDDSYDELRQAQPALKFWQETLRQLVDNPYRRAVQAMVDDVRVIVGEELG